MLLLGAESLIIPTSFIFLCTLQQQPQAKNRPGHIWHKTVSNQIASLHSFQSCEPTVTSIDARPQQYVQEHQNGLVHYILFPH
jgi:hypothetical protein